MSALPGVAERTLDLARALRRAGVTVALPDGLDALRAAAAVDLLDRAALREALAATMTSSHTQRPTFDTLFDLYFPRTHTLPGEEADPEDGGSLEPDAFLDALIAALRAGDEAALTRLARDAVTAFAGVDNADGSRSWFAYRVYRHFNLNGLARRLEMDGGIDGRDDLEARLQRDALAARLRRDEIQARLQRFRAEVDAELRRRQAAERGPEELARRTARPAPEDVDFFSVTAAEQEAMRRAVRPLARKLAARLAVKRKRGRSGRLEVRRTLRRALGTGGVPIDPAYRSRKAHRPDLVVLCDISGSVAAFATFTLLLCHALQGQFARVRSFAFIDTVDEVTRLFAGGDFGDAMARLTAEAEVVWLDGHSDYGHAFEVFATRWREAVTPRSTVLVLGDARNNYRAANTWALAEVAERARRTYWLNPEPRAQWGTGDSIADTYAPVVDDMAECRTLRQLSRFIERIG